MKGAVLALCLLAFAMCQGALINVTPSSPGGLVAALASSTNGDSIVLASGTYEGTGNVQMFVTGYSVSFTSETGNPADVTIQCNFAHYVFVVNAKITDTHPNNYSSIHVNGITFRDCGGEFLQAGAVFYLETDDYIHPVNVNITNCYFRDNEATVAGSTIYSYASLVAPITISIFNTNFVGNLAEYGGAIYTYQTAIAIHNCVFSANKGNYGGAAFFDGGSEVEIKNSNFLLNRALSDTGGAMHVYDIQSFTADNVTFRQNSAPVGGAIVLEQIFNQPVFTECTFDQNVAQSGGAIFLYEGEVTLTRNTFSNNQAYTIDSPYGGGALAAESDSLIIGSYNLFAANSASTGGAVALDESTATFVSNDFEDNWSRGNGGTFYLQRASKLNVNYGSLLNNTAMGRGASVYCNQSTVALNMLTIVQYAEKAKEVNGVVCAATLQNTQLSSCSIDPSGSGDFTGVCSASMLEVPAATTGGGGSKTTKLADWKLAVIIVGIIVGVALISALVAFVASRKGPSTFLQFK